VQRILRRGVGFGAGIRSVACDFDVRTGSAEKTDGHGCPAHFAAAGARRQGHAGPACRGCTMNFARRTGALLFVLTCGFARNSFAQTPADNDHTLQAMRDEMDRAKSRLELKFPGTNEPVRPYYIEYRLLDLDVREVVAQFGALMTGAHTRNRFMNVAARVGNYKQDSSNFISEEGFRGFIGSTGSVGIDRDYDSLRQ